MGALDKFRTPKHYGMTHTKSSEGQLEEGYESAPLPPQYGGGYYIRKKQELEAPLFDPLDPFMLPKTLPAKAAKGALSSLKGAGKLSAEAVARGMEGEGALAQLVAASRPSYVVKPKGGNWLTGSVEDALKGLRRRGPDEQAYIQFLRGEEGAPFTGWLRERVATNPEYQKVDALKAANEYLVGAGRPPIPVDPINSWIEGPLTKYVKTRMASPEDEVRRLAEEGVLHYEPNLPPGFNSTLIGKRAALGQKPMGEAKSPLAVQWEGLTDEAVRADPSQQFQGQFDYSLSGGMADRAYHLQSGTGFSHLIDELSNALRPDSDLPRHLRLTPEAVQNLSMEKAVRRVADTNAWRAAQKVEANRALAEQASVLREYPHSDEMPNPKGLRWVELKSAVDRPDGPASAEFLSAKQQLADQLKYEGDTMGHCVGGYCDDVLSGRSRIFSLRDAKGEPHVTVEVKPGKKLTEKDLPDDVRDTLAEEYGDRSREEFEAAVNRYFADKNIPDRIAQIKGKQNRAPNPEYLPFVQDFVRNNPLGGQWSDVGDLGNTGLRRTQDIWNDLERAKIKGAGHEIGDYASSEDKERIGRAVWGDQWGNYASGGPVEISPPASEQAIMPPSWDTFFSQEAA